MKTEKTKAEKDQKPKETVNPKSGTNNCASSKKLGAQLGRKLELCFFNFL